MLTLMRPWEINDNRWESTAFPRMFRQYRLEMTWANIEELGGRSSPNLRFAKIFSFYLCWNILGIHQRRKVSIGFPYMEVAAPSFGRGQSNEMPPIVWHKERTDAVWGQTSPSTCVMVRSSQQRDFLGVFCGCIHLSWGMTIPQMTRNSGICCKYV